ncbi:hypothetical protein SKAU_G00038460 [Synaphobranchus kaupii]|uniref:Uncharacterized protein n=1 Tax=Synaphobranchus kaupii TaxID=118154 RepID=A0A9Q1JF23_SYNKA|nr:hypothetical protein SKAU_G00038460 [Synaphobranchus kaupii]
MLSTSSPTDSGRSPEQQSMISRLIIQLLGASRHPSPTPAEGNQDLAGSPHEKAPAQQTGSSRVSNAPTRVTLVLPSPPDRHEQTNPW